MSGQAHFEEREPELDSLRAALEASVERERELGASLIEAHDRLLRAEDELTAQPSRGGLAETPAGEGLRAGARVSPGPFGREPSMTAGAAPGPPPEPRVLHLGEPQVLSEPAHDHLVSIVIPVKDAGPGLHDLLAAIRAQRWHGSLEIIALDSASRDETVEILIAFGATVLAVEPGTFNHGLTRNLGAGLARGEELVFVTQSMRPVDDRWLAGLVDPLAANGRLAGVSSRILPHEDADPLTRLDGLRELSFSPERNLRTIEDWGRYRALGPEELRRFVNFHTGSCAIRPEVLGQIPFRAMTTIGEDILWAKEALEAGFSILHEPASVAFHSHDYGFMELLARNFDDGVAMREIVGRRYADETILGAIEAHVAGDLRFLRDECAYAGAELERWCRAATVRRTAQFVGQWLGTEHSRLPPDAIPSLSLARQLAGSLAQRV